MLKSLGKCSLYRLSKAHRGLKLFLYSFLFVILENKVVNSFVATSLFSVPAVTRHVGERSLFRATKLGRKILLSATLNIKKTYKTDLRNMLDDIIDSVSGKLYSRLLFFFSFFKLLSLDCFPFLSHWSPDVLFLGSCPNNVVVEGAGSVSQDRQHDYIFHRGVL